MSERLLVPILQVKRRLVGQEGYLFLEILPLLFSLHLGDAEVPELYNPRAREEDVLRLEIPMQNLPVVDVLESKRCLHEPENTQRQKKNAERVSRSHWVKLVKQRQVK